MRRRRTPAPDDAAKYCKDVKPGGGRVGRCLMEHINELSPGCKDALAQAITRGAGAGKASLASPGDEKSASCSLRSIARPIPI